MMARGPAASPTQEKGAARILWLGSLVIALLLVAAAPAQGEAVPWNKVPKPIMDGFKDAKATEATKETVDGKIVSVEDKNKEKP